MGRKLLRKSALLADLFVSVWLSCALMLMLPASPWQKLAPTAVDRQDKIETVDACDEYCAEGNLPGKRVAQPTYQVIQLFEDDVLHEDHVCLAPVLELKVARVVPLEPDEPHTARLERPPMSRV